MLLRWHKLRVWNTSSTLKLPYISRQALSISAQDAFTYDQPSEPEYANEKSPQPSQPSPSPSTPDPVRPSDQDTPIKNVISPIHQLLLSPVLYDPIRKPRNPIVLCHGELMRRFFGRYAYKCCGKGLYGFDVRGPASFPLLQTQYWKNVLKVLQKIVGADVIVTGVPG